MHTNSVHSHNERHIYDVNTRRLKRKVSHTFISLYLRYTRCAVVVVIVVVIVGFNTLQRNFLPSEFYQQLSTYTQNIIRAVNAKVHARAKLFLSKRYCRPKTAICGIGLLFRPQGLENTIILRLVNPRARFVVLTAIRVTRETIGKCHRLFLVSERTTWAMKTSDKRRSSSDSVNY